MGLVYDDFVLKNAGDLVRLQDGRISETEIRSISVNALVDTGAGTLVINEDIVNRLGLSIRGLRRATLGNDTKEVYKVTEPVEVLWGNRSTTCQALVASKSGEVLVGAIPLEDMDLIVDTARQRLTGAHGDEVMCMLAGIRG